MNSTYILKYCNMDKTMNHVLGMSKDEALEYLRAFSVPYRIVREDGEEFIGTSDVNEQRANLVINDGRVTEVYEG